MILRVYSDLEKSGRSCRCTCLQANITKSSYCDVIHISQFTHIVASSRLLFRGVTVKIARSATGAASARREVLSCELQLRSSSPPPLRFLFAVCDRNSSRGICMNDLAFPLTRLSRSIYRYIECGPDMPLSS